MNQFLGRLIDAYVQYFKAATNPYAILLGIILVGLIFFVFWLVKRLYCIFSKNKEVKYASYYGTPRRGKIYESANVH